MNRIEKEQGLITYCLTFFHSLEAFTVSAKVRIVNFLCKDVSNQGKCKERDQFIWSGKCHFNSCKTQRTAVPKERQKVSVWYTLRMTNITTFLFQAML